MEERPVKVMHLRDFHTTSIPSSPRTTSSQRHHELPRSRSVGSRRPPLFGPSAAPDMRTPSSSPPRAPASVAGSSFWTASATRPSAPTPNRLDRRELVPSTDVDAAGARGKKPAGVRASRVAVSDHLPLGHHLPEPMGFTPAFEGRQFHMKKSMSTREQPIGGRFQKRWLMETLDLQVTPRRASLGHHFAYPGGTPRIIPPPSDDAQRSFTVDGYFTELDMRSSTSGGGGMTPRGANNNNYGNASPNGSLILASTASSPPPRTTSSLPSSSPRSRSTPRSSSSPRSPSPRYSHLRSVRDPAAPVEALASGAGRSVSPTPSAFSPSMVRRAHNHHYAYDARRHQPSAGGRPHSANAARAMSTPRSFAAELRDQGRGGTGVASLLQVC